MPRRRKSFERRIARERIHILFTLAEREALAGNILRANRYAQLARRIGMRYNVPLPSSYRRLFCRKCGSYMLPGRMARVRVRRSRVIVTCQSCGQVYRYPYLREIKERRASRQ